MSPVSGSALPEPSRVTLVPAVTDWSAPAFAVGGVFVAVGATVTDMVSLPSRLPSLAVRPKVRVVVAATAGAVNDTSPFVPVPESVTRGVPSAACPQDSVTLSPSGSVPEPDSVTVAPAVTDWSGPAFATGARLGDPMLTSTVSVSLNVPSLTVRVNVRVVAVATDGAVKVGLTVVGPVSVTAGVPLVCAHE